MLNLRQQPNVHYFENLQLKMLGDLHIIKTIVVKSRGIFGSKSDDQLHHQSQDLLIEK